MSDPIYITALLVALADLRNDQELPHPISVRMAKSTGIATVEVATFGEVMVWADALGAPQNARHSSVFKDGASTHSAWAEWLGWHVRVAAYVDAPVLAVDYLPEPELSGCAGHTSADDCPNHVLRGSGFVSEHAAAVAP